MAAVVLFVVGQVAGYPVLLAVSAAAVGALVAALAVAGRRPRVLVRREMVPDRIERGRPAVVTLWIHNPGKRRQAAFTAEDKVGNGSATVEVRALAPNAQPGHRTYQLPTDRRGRHRVGPLTLSRTDALGLCRSELTLGETATLWVYPRTHPVSVVPAGWQRHHHEGAVDARSLRGSLELREVREYLVGDEVRHLHWKATAKTGQLMIRDYADPSQPWFTVVLDDRREMPAAWFEEAVELVASLVVAAAKADHRCRLLTATGVDVSTDPGVPSTRRLLEELCVVERSREPSLSLMPQGLSGGGTLVVVTSTMSAEDRAALGGPRFTDTVVIVLGARAPEIPGVKVLRAASAVDGTRRWQSVMV